MSSVYPPYFSLTKTFLFVSGISLIWEFIAKNNNSNFKPSYFIDFFAGISNDMFKLCGEKFAMMSSFLTYIKFGDLWEVINDLCTPIFSLLSSPYQFIKGYLCYYTNPYIIMIGSAILVGAIMYIIGKRRLNQIASNITSHINKNKISYSVFGGVVMTCSIIKCLMFISTNIHYD